MEDLVLEQEITELIESLSSPERQTLIQFLDATAPRLQEIHQDLTALIAVFSCMHPLPGAQASRLPTNCPEKQPRWLRSQDSLM